MQNNKEKDFTGRTSEIIDKGLTIIEKRIDFALENEEALKNLIGQLEDLASEVVSSAEKKSLISHIKSLELHKLSEIAALINAFYDRNQKIENKTEGISLADKRLIKKLCDRIEKESKAQKRDEKRI